MRTLSSAWTFFYKFVFPTIWIGGFAVGTLLMFTAADSFQGSGDVREMRWYFLAATVLGGAAIYWSCMRLKKVTLNGDVLLISNFRKEIAIPLLDLERVSGSILMNPELVWLHFLRPTEFGTKIVFMGKWRLSFGFTRHPVVKELGKLIEQASTGAQVSP